MPFVPSGGPFVATAQTNGHIALASAERGATKLVLQERTGWARGWHYRPRSGLLGPPRQRG